MADDKDNSEVFTLDDFSVTQEYLADAQKFTRLAVKKDYEVVMTLEDLEILRRDLRNNSQDSEIAKLTDSIINIYQEFDKNLDPLAQDRFIQDYLRNKYHLRWLIPLVSDLKQVYKKELSDLSPLNKLESKSILSDTLQTITNFDRKPRNPSQLLDALSNYLPKEDDNQKAISVKNPHGLNVLRPSGIESANGTDMELRGVQGDVISHEYLYKTRGKGEGRVIIGKKDFVLVPSEKHNLIGFARLPPPDQIENLVKWGMEIRVEKITENQSQADVLRKFIPTVEELIENHNFSGVIDITVFFELFNYYGHSPDSLSSYNRKRINQIIRTNIDTLPTLTYQIRQRRYISQLEAVLSKYETPIVTNQILTSDPIANYRLIRDPLLSTRFMIFHEIMKQRDNGLIWLTTIANQSLVMAKKRSSFKLDKIVSAQLKQTQCPSGGFKGLIIVKGEVEDKMIDSVNHHEICIWDSENGKYISKKDYIEKMARNEAITLFIPDFSFDSNNLDLQVRKFKVANYFVVKHHDLLNSYYNLWTKTPNRAELLDNLENPLDNLSGYRPDVRDRMAWYGFFRKAVPDRLNQNYLYKGKWIGCQHDYDRLHQKFVNPNDPFPYSKRYTRVIPFNGVVCDFCGETLKEQDYQTDQGFDQFGRRIQITSGNLTGFDSSIRNFFVNKDENISWASKILDLWNTFTHEIPSTADPKKEIQNPQKYNILLRYQEFTRDNVFIPGLVLDPTLLPAKDDNILMFILNTLKMDKTKVTPQESFLLEYLLNLFKIIYKTYELIIQRLAVLMVSVNWYLIHKDPNYLNESVFLETFERNMVFIGKMLLQQKFGPKYNAEIKNMGQRSLPFATSSADRTYPKFNQAFVRSYQHSYKKLSAQEIDSKIKDDYLNLVEQVFYNQNFENKLFNGNFPYEHEIVRIFNNYLSSEGKPTINTLLKNNYSAYWKKWIEGNDIRSQEVDRIRQHLIQESNQDFLYDGISKENGLLYQKYLGQQDWFLTQKIHNLYMELISETIYLIGDANSPANLMGGMDIATKKRYYLGKMLCENWQELSDLDVAGVESFTLLLDQIQTVKIKQTALGTPSFQLIWPYVGRGFARDNKPNPYQIIITPFEAGVIAQANISERETLGRNGIGDATFSISSKALKMPNKDDLELDQYLNEFKFIPNIKELVEEIGGIDYLKDLKKTVTKIRNILEGRGIPVQVCEEDKEIPKEKSEKEMIGEQEYPKDRMRMLNLKNYLITHLRFHIELFTRINRDQLNQYGLQYKYRTLMKSTDFNDAFQDFKIEIPNSQVLDYINFNMNKPDQWKTVSNVLLFLILHDLSRHLRTLRLESTKFVKKAVKGRGSQPGGGLSKYEIFKEFVKNYFQEIEFNTKVQNVPWNHKDLNQTLFHSILVEQQSKIKSKDSIEWGIMKFKLNVEETQDLIDASGPDLDTEVIKNPNADVEDLMEMDFDLGDDGNDYSE